MKWFPNRRGMASGVIVAGFGLGAFVFNQVQTAYVNPNNIPPDIVVNGQKYFSKEVVENVPKLFLLSAGPNQSSPSHIKGMYAGLIALGAIILRIPSTQYELLAESKIAGSRPLTLAQALRTRHFWILWLNFLLNNQATTFLSNVYKVFGSTFIADDRFLSIVGSLSSVANALGRIFWGSVGDRFQFKPTMIVMSVFQIALLFSLNYTQYLGQASFAIWIFLIFFNIGGNFSLFPSATAKTFGQENVGLIYGALFSCNAVGGVVGAVLVQTLLKRLGYFGMLVTVASMVSCGFVMTLIFPKRKPLADPLADIPELGDA